MNYGLSACHTSAVVHCVFYFLNCSACQRTVRAHSHALLEGSQAITSLAIHSRAQGSPGGAGGASPGAPVSRVRQKIAETKVKKAAAVAKRQAAKIKCAALQGNRFLSPCAGFGSGSGSGWRSRPGSASPPVLGVGPGFRRWLGFKR